MSDDWAILENIREANRRNRLDTLDPRLKRLYATDPTVHACLVLYINGIASMSAAMTELSVALVDQKAALLKEAIEARNNQNPIFVLEKPPEKG